MTKPPAAKRSREPKAMKYAARGLSRRRISLRLPDDLAAWLEKVAARAGRSVAAELTAIVDGAKQRGWGR